MTLTLTLVKKQKIILLCDEILSCPQVQIIKVLQLLEKFSSSVIAVPLGKLCYTSLEIDKTNKVKINNGKFDKFMILSKEIKPNIHNKFYKHITTILWVPLLQFLDLIHLC